MHFLSFGWVSSFLHLIHVFDSFTFSINFFSLLRILVFQNAIFMILARARTNQTEFNVEKKDKNQRRKKAAINECEEKEQFRDEIDIIEGKRTILELFVHFFHSIHLPQNSLHSENGAVSNQWLLATIATSRTNSFFCLFKRHRSCWVCVFVCSFSYTKKIEKKRFWYRWVYVVSMSGLPSLIWSDFPFFTPVGMLFKQCLCIIDATVAATSACLPHDSFAMNWKF